MSTTTDKGKGLECPKFSGKDEEYQVWITKFEAYAKVKGCSSVMAGTDVPPPANQATKTAPKLKVEEKNTQISTFPSTRTTRRGTRLLFGGNRGR